MWHSYQQKTISFGDISAQQLIESIIIQSGNKHLNNMQAVTGIG